MTQCSKLHHLKYCISIVYNKTVLLLELSRAKQENDADKVMIVREKNIEIKIGKQINL